MLPTENRLILWTGSKHSGKTTSIANLVQIAHDEGFNVAGVSAPSLYRNGKLIGSDVIDLRSKTRAPLARRKTNKSEIKSFAFMDAGLELGETALSLSATKSAELIIIDEFGPLELNGGGWRRNVDMLLTSSNTLILLVVRQELANRVQQLYTATPSQQLPASESQSIDKVVAILKSRRR